MGNTRSKGDNLKLVALFILIAVSFMILIRGSEYKNIIIIFLVVISIYFGFILKKINEAKKSGELQRVPIPPIANVPEEFKDAQKRFRGFENKKSFEGIKSKEGKMEEDVTKKKEFPEGEETTPEETGEETTPEETGEETTPEETGKETTSGEGSDEKKDDPKWTI